MTASLYAELHRMAAARMRNERRDHTLQPTALVNEAYLRLEERGGSLWGHRSEVLGVAGRVMRNVLVDHARARQADKRGGGAVQVELEDGMALAQGSLVDVLAVDEALSRLAQLDQRQARMIEMHIFGGMTFEEIAEQMAVSSRTVKREWAMGRAWLVRELSPKP